jgi:alpha-tubulin suppressor-like RCC1 family protein
MFFNMTVNHANSWNYINDFQDPLTKDLIRENLYSTFKTALSNPLVSPKTLFDRYGTHIITSYNMGGWIENGISTVNIKENISSDLKVSYETAAGVKSPGVAMKAAFDLEVRASGDYNKGDYKTLTNSEVVGGSGGVSFSTNADTNIAVVNNWINSFVRTGVNRNTYILTDSNLKLVGIWELLPDDDVLRYNELISYFIDEAIKQDLKFFEEFKYRRNPAQSTSGFNSISAGATSTAIKTDGSLFAWGLGPLGDGTTANRLTPTHILDNVVSVSAGSIYTVAIKADGSLWAWGNGPLGDGTTNYRLTPTHILGDVVSVSTCFHTVAIKVDGSLWAWGDNDCGQLGDGTMTDRHTPTHILDNVVCASAGFNHTMAIKADGSLWAWGNNSLGQLGDGTTNNKYTPIHILDDVLSVSAGFYQTMVIKADGSLWAWGYNYSGQLGDGTTTNRYTPTHILDDVLSVSANGEHTMAIKADGSLWAWGNNYYGQLGDGSTNNRYTPTHILDDVSSVSAGTITMAIKADGSLWTWGYNLHGELGDGTQVDKHTPTHIMNGVLRYPKYTVQFEDWDGTKLKREIGIPHNFAATTPTSPSRYGYRFIGWDKDYSRVTANMTVTAIYAINEYTVQFVNWNGAVLSTQTIPHGSYAIAPDPNPTRQGYNFIGWDKDFSNVIEGLKITALFAPIMHVVQFIDWDGSLLHVFNVPDGGTPTPPPPNPTRAGYEFKGWDKDFSNITGDLTVTAVYDIAVTIYIKEATGNIGTIGRVVCDITDDLDFLDKYALVCNEGIDVEIYYSPKRTENAIAAGQNTYIFAVRLPNGEIKKDISFSFKPIDGDIEKNKTIIYGDVNEDGSITTTDATMVTRWAGGNTATFMSNLLAADVNGDGNITTTDATLITRRAGGNTSAVFSIETRVGLITRPLGDINGDGIIDSADAESILRMVVGG